MEIIEKKFRGSQVCKTLSYPIAYGIVGLLLENENKKMNMEEIRKHVKRSKATTCMHLTKLRMMNILRYEKKGKETVYWVKYPKEVKNILDACEKFIERATTRLEKDV